MCGISPMVLQPPQPIAQASRISKSQRFRDLHNKAMGNEFELARAELGVFEGVGSWDAAEDLDPGPGGVAEEAEEGEADSDGDADAQVPEEGGEED